MSDEAASGAAALTADQTRALFDILTHHETYAEIEGFKSPHAVTNYGFPFKKTTKVLTKAGNSWTTTPAGSAPATPRARTPVSFFWGRDDKKKEAEEVKSDDDDDDDDDDDEVMESTSPMLQMLLTRLILPFPGVKELPRDFWAVRMQGLLARFGEADLSESYDKGAMGTRKTLATGASAVIEMVARGALGGIEDAMEQTKQDEKKDDGSKNRLMSDYDLSKAEDLERAWNDCMQEWAYGDFLDQVYDHLSKTEDIEGHSPAVKAAADYAIIHLATFAHQVFILSPEGQYLVRLLENLNNLIPYKVIKQTLRIGNAATMISGMVRVFLAKLSVTSITNWVGLTANADDGMNMLQRILSMVLMWDASEFKKSADKIEKAKEDRPTEEMLQAIRKHVNEARGEHDAVRETSSEHSQSIITAILNASNPDLVSSLTEGQHAQCLEYYSALLAVRDPIKDVVGAYDPIIRSVHSRVDIREHLDSMQGFISDFIHASKPKKDADGEERMSSVEDYVRLVRDNRGLMYRWVHAVAKECPDVWAEMRVWAKAVAVEFRERGSATNEPKNMSQSLNDLFTSLDPDSQEDVLAAINSHATYLSKLTLQSKQHLQQIISSTGSSTNSDTQSKKSAGPGVYLARWQHILDTTPITPSEIRGSLRHGRDVKHVSTMGKLGLGGKRLDDESDGGANLKAPDVSIVVEALGEKFKAVVREKAGSGVPN
ncbi:hypothetical protein PT974_05160 [Cladobotryum mycophilum]|uniref:PX domain-containing protein n=1 Tax=Cladobotryum mycophilum TaxID=491253 RepID=A0ABR0SR69_9HYPO